MPDQPKRDQIEYRWCPVCRQEVPVKKEGKTPEDGFTPLCPNCDVCLLKTVGSRRMKT